MPNRPLASTKEVLAAAFLAASLIPWASAALAQGQTSSPTAPDVAAE